MNARVSLLRAGMAPVALAACIALAFGLSTPVQAQYTYPGTASATPTRAAQAKPAPADQVKRPARSPTDAVQNCPRGQGPCGGTMTDGMGGKTVGGAPKKTGTPGYPAYHQANAVRPAAGAAIQATAYGSSNPTRHRNTNPSMQPGEACPPGSNCAPHGSNQQTNGGGPARPGAYGAHESYGYATSPTSAQKPASRNASVSPVRAGARGAFNYGPSQTSNTNFRNSVTGKTSGLSAPNMNSGQPTSVPGPNGPVHVGSPTSYTGVGGKKHGLGQQTPDLTGGGFGHQVTRQQNPMGNIGKASGGGAPQGAFGMDPYKAGNGSAGAMEGDRTNPNFQKGQSKKGGVAVYDGPGHTLVSSGSTEWNGTTQSGHPDNGNDRNGTEWKNGVVWDGTDEHGTKWREGKSAGGTVPSQDELDRRKDKLGGNDVAPEIVDAGPGEIVSGTGQVVQPGKKKGQDTGGGQTGDAGTTNSGGQNAQGQYIAPSGQDAPVKPKEAGALKMDFNGKNGAIDPKLNGGTGGG